MAEKRPSWWRRKIRVPVGKGFEVSLSIILIVSGVILLCCCWTGASMRKARVLPTYTPTVTRTLTPTDTPASRPTDTPAPPTVSLPTDTAAPASPTAEPATAASPQAACTWSSAYVADVTIPDGTQIEPGNSFIKTWQIQNVGTCDWEGIELVFAEGDRMQGATRNPIQDTAAGRDVEVSVEMVAPSEPGEYSGKWSICRGGDCFGWVTVAVVSGRPAAPTSVPQPTVVPAPVVQPTQPPPAAVCDCSGDLYNCDSFATHRQAQTCFEYCVQQGRGDIHGLDRDNDGRVCESLP